MKHFIHLASGINVAPLAIALQQNPQLWNLHAQRRTFEGTSHRETSDIWLRYNDIKNLNPDDYAAFTQEHDAVWYPEASVLPQAKDLALDIMAKCRAVRLGGVLITRIPPKGHVLPHTDKGWHPEYYNVKVYIPVATNDQCVNRVEDEHVIMAPGEAWHFDNTVEHEVYNGGTTERITLIICMRVDV